MCQTLSEIGLFKFFFLKGQKASEEVFVTKPDGPQFDPWNLHGLRREPIHRSSPLTSTHVTLHMCVHTQ